MRDRGLHLDHTTIYRWLQQSAPTSTISLPDFLQHNPPKWSPLTGRAPTLDRNQPERDKWNPEEVSFLPSLCTLEQVKKSPSKIPDSTRTGPPHTAGQTVANRS